MTRIIWLNDKTSLFHHGVKGMKWGVRRYQNYDGSRIRSKKNSSIDRVKIAKRYVTHDTDAKQKGEALSIKREAELKSIKRPKDSEWYTSDGTLTKKGREYLDKTNRIEDKYFKEERKLWDEAQKEREEQSRSIFLNSEVEPDVKAAKQTLNNIKTLQDTHLGPNSDNYKKAFKKYEATHSREKRDDIEYGFNHYEWRQGNKDFDTAYKAYQKEAKTLEKKYETQTTNIGKKILSNQFDDYKDDTMFEVDQFVRHRYDEFNRK